MVKLFRNIGLFGLGLAVSASVAMAADDSKPYTVNDQDELVQPSADDFREWVFVGTPLTPNDMNDGKASFPEFHMVYIDPGSWDHYKKTGEFRDGTILIKELTSVGAKKATSGNGYFMGDYTGLEATIKSKELHPDEPGNWGYYSFGHEYPLAETAKVNPTAACAACHTASAAEDMVFTQYYPVLRAAKSKADKQAELNHELPMPDKNDLALVAGNDMIK